MGADRLGRRGEDLAVAFLGAKGYTILGRNVRVGRWEADVLARLGKTLVVAEVKARRGGGRGFPEEAVGAVKRRRLLAVAARVAAAAESGVDVRLDVVTILRRGRRCLVLRHLRGALWA